MAISPAMIIKRKINPTLVANLRVPKNSAMRNLKTVLDMAARVMAVAAVVGVMVFGARSDMLMVMASTSATPEIMLAK